MYFTKNDTTRTPVGKNVYLRSTDDIKTDSFTMAMGGIPETVVDGIEASVTNKELTSNVAELTTSAAHGFSVGDNVYVAIGDPVFDGHHVITAVGTTTTFSYERINANVGSAADTGTAIANGDRRKILQPGTLIASITSGADDGKVGVFSAAASDGRQTVANVVGVTDTFLPWELTERDAPIAVVYEATVVQAWCFEYDASDQPIALSNTTRDAIIAAGIVGLQLNYR